MGSVLSYVFYWLAVIVVLVYLKWSEVRRVSRNSAKAKETSNQGRVKLFGRESAVGRARRERREARENEQHAHEASDEK